MSFFYYNKLFLFYGFLESNRLPLRYIWNYEYSENFLCAGLEL